MAKICPITEEPVLYLECLECEYKNNCPPDRNQEETDVKEDRE